MKVRKAAWAALAAALGSHTVLAADPTIHDLILRNGMIYDGSGGNPYRGDLAVDGDRISYVGSHADGRGRSDIDVKGQAIAPGFINMLAHREESLFADGRALSDLTQGVTLEVLGEDSMGPVNETMRQLMVQRQSDIKYAVTWNTLGEYLETLQRRGIAPNIASFIGASEIRTYVLGEGNVQPRPISCSRCGSWCIRRWRRVRSG